MMLTPEQVNEILNSFDKISSVVGGTSQTDRKKANAEQIRVFDLAIADFTQAIRLDPDNAKAYKERGSSYNSKGDNDRAIADFESALRIDPYFDDARENLAVARS